MTRIRAISGTRTIALALTLLALVLAADSADGSHTALRGGSRRLETMEYMAAMTGTRPFCFIEHGVDYLANDIGSAPGATADDCCLPCIRTVGCKAFSWSAHNNGTCWFKSGRGTVVVNPDAKSSVVLFPDEPGKCAAVEENIDFVGNDIASTRRCKVEDCCADCDKQLGCRAFTWTDHEGGTCWLKSDKGRAVVKQGARSVAAFAVSQYPNCGLEVGVDYVGNDIGTARACSPSDCCAKCADTKGCRAFSWTNQDGGTCFFKNRKDVTVPKCGVTSATVFPNPPAPSCAMEIGVDYVGNDIGRAPSADPYGCCSICMRTTGCKAFSWTGECGGTCWLKGGKCVAVAKANVQSAVV